MKKLITTITILLSLTAYSQEQVVLKKSNTLVLDQVVDTEITTKLIREAQLMDQRLGPKEPIILVVNSPGGSIVAGIEFMEALKGLGRPVHTLNIFAASMAFQIVQNMNTRLSLSSGEYMSHRARGTVANGTEFGGKEPSQTTNRINHWINIIKGMDLQTVKRTNGKQTYKSYTEAYDDELWLTADNAVAQGYADKVVVAKCDASLLTTKTEEFTFFGMNVQLLLSNCPLNSGPLDVKVNIITKNGIKMSLKSFLDQGGVFGNSCKQGSLCPLDVTLTEEGIKRIKASTIKSMFYKKDQITYNYGVF